MITLNDIKEKLDLEVRCGEEDLQRPVTGGYVSDLLSDVMGNAAEGQVWITLQAHLNVVAIAALKELAAVVLVNGITPESSVLEKAGEEGVAVMVSKFSAFDTAGKLYEVLNNNE